MNRTSIAFIIILLGMMPVFQSCLDNEEPKTKLVISTINKIQATDHEFDFTLDNGETMFPHNGQEWKSSQRMDGQRAFVLFEKLDQSTAGYDYTIEVKQIKDILTKEIVTLNEDGNTEEKIGDDKINSTYMWISKDKKYLTIEFQYYRSPHENKKHFLNLVMQPSVSPSANLSAAAIQDPSFINLEFRHNNENKEIEPTETMKDNTSILTEGYVSFKLNKIKEKMEGKKGLRIRVNTLYKGVQYYDVTF